MSNFTYMIIDVDKITSEQLKNSRAEDFNNLRKSIDESKYLVKTKAPSESCYDGLDKYTHDEILTILNGSDWQAPMPDVE